MLDAGPIDVLRLGLARLSGKQGALIPEDSLDYLINKMEADDELFMEIKRRLHEKEGNNG